MYFKGSNLIHTIRQIINDDEKFREILRGLNKDFYRQTVTSAQVEQYISEKTKIDFSKVFDQYLRTAKIPVLERKGNMFRWSNCVAGFNMPVKLKSGYWIMPTTLWKDRKQIKPGDSIEVDSNFYINTKKI